MSNTLVAERPAALSRRLAQRLPRSTWDPWLIAALVFLLAAWRTRTNYISPYDEMYHLSYVQYLAHGHLPRNGDSLNTWARQAFSCHPVFPFGQTTKVPCGKLDLPAAYPEGGTFTAAGWPPVYYAVAVLVLRVVGLFGVGPFEGGRLTSALFYGAGAGLLALAMRRLGAGRKATYGAVLLLAAAPVSDVLGSFTTPHSATLLLAALSLLFLAWAVDESRPSAAHVAVGGVGLGGLVALTQPHAVVALAICALAIVFVGVREVSRRGPLRPQLLRLGAPMLAPFTAVLVYAGWEALQSARAVAFGSNVNVSAVTNLPDPTGSVISRVVGMWWYFLPGAVSNDALGYGVPEQFLAGLLVVLTLAGLGAALLAARPSHVLSALAWSTFIVAPLAAVAMDAYFSFPLPLRYGFPVVPVLVALLGASTGSRSARWLVLGSGVGAYVFAAFIIWP